MMIDVMGGFWYFTDEKYYNIVYFSKNNLGYTRRNSSFKVWDHCIKEDWN